MSISKLFYIFIFGIISSQSFAQDTIYIKQRQGSGFADGKSWKTAYGSLVSLNSVGANDEVWIAKGHFLFSDDDFRDFSYHMNDGVSIYGGFEGNETSRENRDFVKNETIIDGELGDPNDGGDNMRNIFRTYTPIRKFIMDGLTIQNGYAFPRGSEYTEEYEDNGGGIFLITDSVDVDIEIRNCNFYNNSAYTGLGGSSIFFPDIGSKIVDNSLIKITNCNFVNDSNYSIFAKGNLPFEIKECTFMDCQYGAIAIHSEGLIESCEMKNCGLALSIQYGMIKVKGSSFINNGIGTRVGYSSVKVENCIYKNNQIGIDYVDYIENITHIDVSNCIFDNNIYGMFHIALNTYYYGNKVSENVTINNSIFSNNTGFALGLFNRKSIINNCIFYNNQATENFGVVSNFHDTLEVYNSIFYKNQSDSILYSANTIVKNCLFDTGDCDDFTKLNYYLEPIIRDFDTIFQTSLACENNIFNSNPEFKDPENNDFTLKICSPAINRGYNSIIDSLGLLYDYQGNPRIQGSHVDIGIYEYEYNEISFDTIIQNVNGDIAGKVEIENVRHGTAPYTYLWTDGSTSTYIEGLEIGQYSLSITDADGCEFVHVFEISDHTATENILSDLGISIYPNPIQNNQKAIINYKSTHSSKVKISFIDIAGRIIDRIEMSLTNGQNWINVPREKGIYMVKVEMENGSVGFEKMVVY